MLKFKDNKLELLRELRRMLTEDINNVDVNVDLQEDVADFLADVTDKRRHRRLKLVRKELDKWIEEMLQGKK